MRALSTAILFFITTIVSAQLPADRKELWSAAGYFGMGDSGAVYLDVTTFGAVGDGMTDNYSAVSSAINSLNGGRGVVYFPPGEYLIRQTLSLPDSVILKGAGSDSTFLKFDLNGVVGNCINISASGLGVNADVIGGFSRGSNYIVVSDPSSFSSGDFADLYQSNGTWDTDPAPWASNSVGQILRITDVSADTLFIENPLRFTYDSLLSPKVRRLDPRHEVGIECLRIERLDNVPTGVCFNINYFGAANCWVKGVESSKSIGSHIEIDLSTNIQVTGCYIHQSFLYDGASTHGYGITLFAHSGQCRIENNIMRMLRHSFSMQTGANGNVIAYNYSREPNRSEFPADYGADISLHGHYPFANLFEGNIIQNIGIDQAWGPNGPRNTFLRNRAELYGLIVTSGTVQSDTLNLVGNEIPNMGLFLGNYILAGGGHFEYGNIVRGTLTPAGTSSLTDTSYFLNSAPAYWIGGPWPSIGTGVSTSSIPAKDRYLAGGVLTQCELPIINSIPDRSEVSVNVFPNPAHGTFSIETAAIVTKVIVSDATGRTVFVHHDHSTHANVNVESLTPGIYFVNISTVNGDFVKRIILF